MFLRFVVFKIAYLRGKRYETEKKIRGGTGANQYAAEQILPNDESALPTHKSLAKEYGVYIGGVYVVRNRPVCLLISCIHFHPISTYTI